MVNFEPLSNTTCAASLTNELGRTFAKVLSHPAHLEVEVDFLVLNCISELPYPNLLVDAYLGASEPSSELKKSSG